MSSVILSRLAVTDLIGIAEYSIVTFGIEQARAYRDGLDSCFRYLAENPLIGRGAVGLAEGLRRYEYQSHVIFYLLRDQGILIVRVLHRAMDFRRRL